MTLPHLHTQINRRTQGSVHPAAALAGAALYILLTACSKVPAPTSSPVEVVVEEVKPQSISLTYELPGRTKAFQSSPVRPQVGGILRKRLFTEGARVEQGDLLYEVEPAPYQAAYDVAQGELAHARAEVLAARPKAQRYSELVALDAISKQDDEDAVAALRQSEAAVITAEGAVRAARINLNNTSIKAPISGRIGTSNYTAGALVSAEQDEALATINQLDPIHVDVVQSSAQWLALRRRIDSGKVISVKGKPQVKLIMEDGVNYSHSGTLEVVDASVKETTGSVKLRAIFPNPDGLLLPGMYVKALLSLATDPKAIMAPQRAITRNNKGEALAMVVGGDGKVRQRVVQTADAMGDRWVITSGLQAGDRVIVEGMQRIRPGQSVKVVPAASAPQDSSRKPAT